MIRNTNPKRLFASLLVATSVSIFTLPAQATTLSQQMSATSVSFNSEVAPQGNEASHGDGVDNRQCKLLRRAGKPLPGYCF